MWEGGEEVEAASPGRQRGAPQFSRAAYPGRGSGGRGRGKCVRSLPESVSAGWRGGAPGSRLRASGARATGGGPHSRALVAKWLLVIVTIL